MKPSMMIALVDPISRVMNSRVSLNLTCASSKVLRYITPYMNTIEVAIIAPKRRYGIARPLSAWPPPGVSAGLVWVVSSSRGIEVLHHVGEAPYHGTAVKRSIRPGRVENASPMT